MPANFEKFSPRTVRVATEDLVVHEETELLCRAKRAFQTRVDWYSITLQYKSNNGFYEMRVASTSQLQKFGKKLN